MKPKPALLTSFTARSVRTLKVQSLTICMQPQTQAHQGFRLLTHDGGISGVRTVR